MDEAQCYELLEDIDYHFDKVKCKNARGQVSGMNEGDLTRAEV